jgi:hypothetical protein
VISLELELRLLAKSYPLSPCGKRNPPPINSPLWQFSAFRNANLESGTAKKKQVCLKNWNCKLELETESGFYDGRRFSKKFVEVVSWSTKQKVKEQSNEAKPETLVIT